jgi:hypothetical protein
MSEGLIPMHSKTVAALAMVMLILLGATGISSVLADESNAPGSSVGNSSRSILSNASKAPLTLELENHTYYPNDTVRAFVYNMTDPLIDVIDPLGAIHNIDAVRLNDSAFMGEYALNRSIILANYTVIATDNATGETVNDTFEVTMRPDKAVVLGNYTVFAYINENGTYNYTISYFNVTTGESPTAASMPTMQVSTGPAVKTLYLHEAPTPFMNTSMSNTASGYVDLKNNAGQTWSQTPEFALDFNILDDPAVTIYAQSANNFVKMNVTLISTNGVSSSTLGSIDYQASATPGVTTSYTFNVPLSGNNVTVPGGYKLLLCIDNLNNRKLTIYESTQYPSHIDMNTLSYIDVISVNIYDQYSNQVTNTTPPSTVKVLANVTDPFGSYDISDVNLTLYYNNGTAALGPLSMNLSTTDGSSPSMWKLFERNVSLGNDLDSGSYSISVTANESNGVKNSLSAPLAIEYPVNVSVSKSYSPIAGNSFLIAINLKNNDNHTAFGVHAYDFYASDFSVAGFSQPCTSVSVNNAILQGNLNVFGPFTLSPFQTVNITYTAQGIGDYKLSNMTIVGVDPYV